jgi:hypothetical protein
LKSNDNHDGLSGLASLSSLSKATAYVLPLANIPAIEKEAKSTDLVVHFVPSRANAAHALVMGNISGYNQIDDDEEKTGILVIGSDIKAVRKLVASIEDSLFSSALTLALHRGQGPETPKAKKGLGIGAATGYMAVGAAAMLGGLAFS